MAGILSRSMLSVALLAGVLVGISTSAGADVRQIAAGDSAAADLLGGPQPLPPVPRGRDFLLHTDSGRGRSVLASEQALELQSDGRGWARNTVNRLCIDRTGRSASPAPATTSRKAI